MRCSVNCRSWDTPRCRICGAAARRTPPRVLPTPLADRRESALYHFVGLQAPPRRCSNGVPSGSRSLDGIASTKCHAASRQVRTLHAIFSPFLAETAAKSEGRVNQTRTSPKGSMSRREMSPVFRASRDGLRQLVYSSARRCRAMRCSRSRANRSTPAKIDFGSRWPLRSPRPPVRRCASDCPSLT